MKKVYLPILILVFVFISCKKNEVKTEVKKDPMEITHKVVFETNHAGGITGGLSTGQPIVAKLAVKPTPTIDKPQKTIDKYTLENKDLAAITRRDPTIVARIWPVAENYTAMVILDNLFAHYGYQMLKDK